MFKNAMNPHDGEEKLNCFECQEGVYEKVTQTYRGTLHVLDIEVLTCNKCGDECLDNENCRKIDEVLC
jgi:hypothetical protein